MDFVSLVRQGGLLWKAWVACHYERRLKRHDYLTADVSDICEFLLKNLSGIPLRCLGHLMLGILRLLLRQASDLEAKAEEVRTALQTSLCTGPGLPTVQTLAASAVTLRHHAEQAQPLDLGGDGLDMLMEELPEMEVEASLEEGRRHVAPLALITLSPEPVVRQPRVDLGDEFGAANAEDLASLAAIGKAAIEQIQEEVQREAHSPQPSLKSQQVLERSAGKENLPPIDFLLGAESTPSPSFRARDIVMQEEGDADMAAAAEAAAMEAEAFAAEAEQAAAEAEATARCVQEQLGELPAVDFLLTDAAEEDTGPIGPLVPSMPVAAEVEDACLELLPRVGEEALQEVPERKQKRRRKRIWLDEKVTLLPEKSYEDTSKITRENPLEYGLFLPHKNYDIGLTTFFSDLCPVLRDPLRRAADIGARRRRARAEEPAISSPPKAALVVQLEVSSPQAVADDHVMQPPVVASDASAQAPSPDLAEVASPPRLLHEAEALAAPLASTVAVVPFEEIQPDIEMLRDVEAAHEAAIAPSATAGEEPCETAEVAQADLPRSPGDVAKPSSQREAPSAEILELVCAPADSADASSLGVVESPKETKHVPGTRAVRQEEREEEQVTGLPPAKRQAQGNGGQLVPVKVALPQVKQEIDLEVDLDRVSAKQGRELRETLQEDKTLSFLDLCNPDHCSAEAAACRFVDLLSLHMNGAIFLQQEQPYADIAVLRGQDWQAWCNESKRGMKREPRAEA
mmetsp:Transcript_60762/g.113608  ORF Transcript_60762/g.113608 Transcript_60762/m.113608 type:complete len:742 (+) Transcript_60762:43-2268(+)